MGKILMFKPPPDRLKRLLILSLERSGAKPTGERARADHRPAEIVPLFRTRRRRQRF